MTRMTCLRGGALALGAMLLSAVPAQVALAQGATITGRVTNEAGAAIVGANLIIQQLNVATTTGQNGTYTLTIPTAQANGQTVTLSARFIGFAPLSRQVTLTAGSQTQDFSLKADPFRLEEMVVTGVAEATSVKKLPFSVSSVTGEQLSQVPGSSPVAALAGKVSGARIAVGTGNPGASPTIRLRGSTNLGIGGSQPLIIVDGVITKASISDIDASDIESIEVLKGAAAASFYGSDAANGVVNITTKRGRNVADGETSLMIRSEYGQQDLERFVPLNRSHVYELDASGEIRLTDKGQRVVEKDGIADNPYPTSGPNRWRNQAEEWMQNGESWSTTAQLGVRRGNTNLHSTFTTSHNQGILPMTRGQDRQNFRLNVDQAINEKIDLSASATYGVNKQDMTSSSEGWFALLQAPPDLDLRYPRGEAAGEFHRLLPDWAANSRGNPLYRYANDAYESRRERILGSVVGRYRPTDWLRFEASYGTDRSNRRVQDYYFRGYETEGGKPGPGEMEITSANDVAVNSQLNATVSRTFFDELASTTRLAYIYEEERNNYFEASGERFFVGDVPDLNALDPEQRVIGSSSSDIRAINYAVSQNLDFRDRYILDVMFRRDGSSLFGSEERWQNFYRVAGAWRVSEDFEIPGVQELKIRAARGTAGLRPQYSDQYETYSVGSGTVSPSQLGNKNLKPAIQTEDEYGINVQFLDRFNLEVVRAERETEGAFLAVPLSARVNGFTSQVQNAATVGAKTTELMLDVMVTEREKFGYSFTLTADKTTQKILHMDRAPFRVNAGGQNQDVFYYKSGETLGIIYGARWVTDPQQLLDNPANAGIDLANYEVNPLGYVIKKGSPSTPIAYVDADGNSQFRIGDVNPDFSFGWANNIRYGNFGVYALVDGVVGGDIYNHTRQWMYQDHRHGDMDMAGVPAEKQVPNAFFASGLYNANAANTHFVEDGTYARLRELSVSYDFTPEFLGRVGLDRMARGAKVALIGRNLLTFTDYSGFDPEVTSGNDFNFRIDGFRYPNFRQISAQVELRF
ncbi:MAG TPA: SusC/RagA family TonB-linked outer membrane protein [Gemmatimonadales bacterium]